MNLIQRIVAKRAEVKDTREVEAMGRFAKRISRLRGEGELATSKDPEVTLEVVSIDVKDIIISEDDTRKSIGDLSALVTSIKTYGIQQPIKVARIRGKGRKYRLVFGRRRLLAAKQAGQAVVPCIVELSTKADRLRMLYVAENILRKPLTPQEEAATYNKMLTEDNLDKAELARTIGCNVSLLDEKLRCLSMPTS